MLENIIIQVENRSELEAIAHKTGYRTCSGICSRLNCSRCLEADDLSPAERFRAGWREAVAGHEGIPYDQMWEGLGE